MDLQAASRITALALLTFWMAPSLPRTAWGAEAGSQDGFLSQKLEILVYPSDHRFEQSGRGWTFQREISLFQGYLWRYSLRRLSVETHIDIVHRKLLPEELLNYGPRFGFLLDRSPQVISDLRARGVSGLPLLLLYDAPPARPSRIAGRTFIEGGYSSIPLSPRYFQDDGFDRPLHLVMAHEYLHQIDLAFSRLRRPSSFLDPDGAGLPGYPPCIDPGGGDLSLRSILQFDSSCKPVDWEALAPAYGTWMRR
jgi:hypothetical protein